MSQILQSFHILSGWRSLLTQSGGAVLSPTAIALLGATGLYGEQKPKDDAAAGDANILNDRGAEPKRLTENELSDFSRLWHDGCSQAIIEAQNVDRNHSTEV